MQWNGYFVDTKEVQQFSILGSEHDMLIMLKMDPSESAFYPDLVMSISSGQRKLYRSVLSSMQKGDEISFKAKMVTMGNEFKMHHMHMLDFQKTGRTKKLDEIIVKESALPTKIDH